MLDSIRNWGSTPEERTRNYPCDHVLPSSGRKTHYYFRAVSVAAPRPVVYRWLCQMRVAPYSYDWIDNLGRQSPRQLTPGVENLEVGQTMVTVFELVSFEVDRHVTIRARPWLAAIMGETVMSYWLEDDGAGTRLILKIAIKYPFLPYGWLMQAFLPTADAIMARRQLLNFKELSEGVG